MSNSYRYNRNHENHIKIKYKIIDWSVNSILVFLLFLVIAIALKRKYFMSHKSEFMRNSNEEIKKRHNNRESRMSKRFINKIKCHFHNEHFEHFRHKNRKLSDNIILNKSEQYAIDVLDKDKIIVQLYDKTIFELANKNYNDYKGNDNSNTNNYLYKNSKIKDNRYSSSTNKDIKFNNLSNNNHSKLNNKAINIKEHDIEYNKSNDLNSLKSFNGINEYDHNNFNLSENKFEFNSNIEGMESIIPTCSINEKENNINIEVDNLNSFPSSTDNFIYNNYYDKNEDDGYINNNQNAINIMDSFKFNEDNNNDFNNFNYNTNTPQSKTKLIFEELLNNNKSSNVDNEKKDIDNYDIHNEVNQKYKIRDLKDKIVSLVPHPKDKLEDQSVQSVDISF